MKVSPFAYQIGLKLDAFRGKKILLAFSGGRDSCILLEVLFELRERLNLEIAVGHIHHGDDTSLEQKKYRDDALSFSQTKAREKNLAFLFEKASSPHSQSEASLPSQSEASLPSQSEASLRKLRSTCLEKMRVDHQFDVVAYAHHAQDLFETRLIRLIRGTGQQGLEAMGLVRDHKLRPLLSVWPDEILTYARHKKIEYLEDPSNSNTHYLRNWLRRDWLTDLEGKRPGATRAFARSLELLSENTRPAAEQNDVIDRGMFQGLSLARRRTLVAEYLRRFSRENYSSHIVQEICKRLDTSQKELSFTVGGLEWTTNAKQIEVRLKETKAIS